MASSVVFVTIEFRMRTGFSTHKQIVDFIVIAYGAGHHIQATALVFGNIAEAAIAGTLATGQYDIGEATHSRTRSSRSIA